MAKKVQKYSAGSLCLMLFAALGILSLFLPIISGAPSSIPAGYLNGSEGKLLSIYGIMFLGLKALPLLLVFIIQLLPANLIKKYVVTFCFGIYLTLGELLIFLIFSQRFAGGGAAGFYIGIVSAVLISACCLFFTKINKTPKKQKDMVWYRGFNKIFILIGIPICAGFTAGIILFHSLVFSFSFNIIMGIFCIWGCLVLCSIISIFSLYGKDKQGIFFYLAAFLNVLGVVLLCWSKSVMLMAAGAVVAIAFGLFWFTLGNVARRHF